MLQELAGFIVSVLASVDSVDCPSVPEVLAFKMTDQDGTAIDTQAHGLKQSITGESDGSCLTQSDSASDNC